MSHLCGINRLFIFDNLMGIGRVFHHLIFMSLIISEVDNF